MGKIIKNEQYYDEFSLALRSFIQNYKGIEEVSPIMYECHMYVDTPNNHKRFYTIINPNTSNETIHKEIEISIDIKPLNK
jgi:hypothetical protein